MRHSLRRPLLLLVAIAWSLIPACGSEAGDGSGGGYACVFESRFFSISESHASQDEWETGCYYVEDEAECDRRTERRENCSSGICTRTSYRNVEFRRGSCDDLVPLEATGSTDDEQPAAEPPPETPAAEPPPDAPAAEPAPVEYRFLQDGTGTLGFDVPVGWSDVVTEPEIAADGSRIPRIVAAPELEGFSGSHEGSGVGVWYLEVSRLGTEPVAEWLDGMIADDLAACDLVDSGGTDAGAHVFLNRCGTAGSNLSYITVDSDDGSHRLLVAYQWLEQHEEVYLDQIFRSLVIN